MKKSTVIWVCLLAFGCGGCTIIPENRDPGRARVFPKLDWYWSADGKAHREEVRAVKEWQRTNTVQFHRY